MTIKPNELPIEHFRNELLSRFFHPDSYFMHCFNHHLKTFLNEGGNSNNNEYLLVGNLMDKLLSSQNVLQQLELILTQRGLKEFNERLSEGVKYLYESDLEPEKMKIEIESLAQSMFASAIAAFQNKENNHEIKNLLGMSHTSADSVDTLELQEPSSEGPGQTEPEFSMEEIEGMEANPQDKYEEEDFLLPLDERKDANPDKLEIALVEEGGSYNSAGSGALLANSVVNQQPASVSEAFQLAVGNQIELLQNKMDPLNSKSLLECEEIFESIISSSMIYGFDAVEEVAAKARRFLSKVNKQPNPDSGLAASLLTKTILVLKKAIKDGPDKVDKKAISDLSQNLMNSNIDLPAKENSIARAQNHEKKNETVVSGNSNLEEFKLPGEDEIFSLLSEISENSAPKKDADMELDSPRQPEPEVLVTDIPQVEPGDLLSTFKQQAELYFNVIEQALNLLEGQPGHKTALKDIELACNSLYELAIKNNLDSISQIPSLISELIRNNIDHRYSLSKEEQSLIKNSLKDFRNISSEADMERPKFKEYIKLIQAVNSTIIMSRSPLRETRSIDRFKAR